MKKLTCFLLSIILLLGCTGCSATNYKKNKKEQTEENVSLNESFVADIKDRGYLVVGCKMDVPELSFYDEANDSWSGLEVELAYKTAAHLFETTIDDAKARGLVHFVGVTVANREERLASGDIDLMLATFTITDERSKKYAFSDSYYTDYVGIMVVDYGRDADTLGGQGIKTLADLDGKYIGVPRNATTREDFINYIETMTVVNVQPIFCEYEDYSVLKKALMDGNIDAFAVDVSILNGYDDENTTILNERFAGQHYGAAVLKENAELLTYVNQAIAE